MIAALSPAPLVMESARAARCGRGVSCVDTRSNAHAKLNGAGSGSSPTLRLAGNETRIRWVVSGFGGY